jgi:hypothetical protein
MLERLRQLFCRQGDSQEPACRSDALEEAGCDNADMLSHCRGPGPHVRGCWVVDLVTGRA